MRYTAPMQLKPKYPSSHPSTFLRVLRAGCLLALALPACDDKSVTPRDEACMRYCEKLDLCDDRTDRAGCVQRCGEDRVRSDAYFRARANCVETRSCNLWQGEVDVMGRDTCELPAPMCKLDDCVSDTLAAADPTPDEKTYCGQVTSKLGACDNRLVPADVEARCLALAPTLSRDYLEAMLDCIALPCEQVTSCLERVLDRFNTDLTFTPIVSAPVDAGMIRP